jgi:hypothetical protein
MRKWLWVLVIALPVLATLQVIGTVQSVGNSHQVVAPRYVEATERALAELDSKTLAKLSANLLSDHKKMAAWWNWARDAYELTSYVLLALVFLFAAVLGVVLWRMPSNPALNTDAERPQRAG